MKKCKLCGTATEWVCNINFKAVPICHPCSSAVFVQHATWCHSNLNVPRETKVEITRYFVVFYSGIDNDSSPVLGHQGFTANGYLHMDTIYELLKKESPEIFDVAVTNIIELNKADYQNLS